jgi:alkylhydroperoxidase family enzyme
MVSNDTSENEAIFAVLKNHFSDSELVELTMSIGFFIGVGRMNHFLDLDF